MTDETSRKLWAEIRRLQKQNSALEMRVEELQQRLIEKTLELRDSKNEILRITERRPL